MIPGVAKPSETGIMSQIYISPAAVFRRLNVRSTNILWVLGELSSCISSELCFRTHQAISKPLG